MQTIKDFIASHPKIRSAVHTFVATFVTVIGSAIAALPIDQIMSPETWSTTFLISLVATGVRAGLKKVFPLE